MRNNLSLHPIAGMILCVLLPIIFFPVEMPSADARTAEERIRLEEWSDFGRGWELTRLTAEQLTLAYSPLIAYAKAWSTSTRGTVEGEPICFDAADESDVEGYRGKLAGR